MPVEEIVSAALLFLGVVLGPVIVVITIVGYGVSAVRSRMLEIREQRYLRSLPCHNCRYFMNEEFLQCAVNPACVLTDEAHSCRDFSMQGSGHHASRPMANCKPTTAQQTFIEGSSDCCLPILVFKDPTQTF